MAPGLFRSRLGMDHAKVGGGIATASGPSALSWCRVTNVIIRLRVHVLARLTVLCACATRALTHSAHATQLLNHTGHQTQRFFSSHQMLSGRWSQQSVRKKLPLLVSFLVPSPRYTVSQSKRHRNAEATVSQNENQSKTDTAVQSPTTKKTHSPSIIAAPSPRKT